MADEVYAVEESPINIGCQSFSFRYRVWTNVWRRRQVFKYYDLYTEIPGGYNFDYYLFANSQSRNVIQTKYFDNKKWDTSYYCLKKFVFYGFEAYIGPMVATTKCPSVNTLYAHNITSNSAKIYAEVITPAYIKFGYNFEYQNMTTGIISSTGWLWNFTLYSGTREFSKSIFGLSPDTEYKFRMLIINSPSIEPIVYGQWRIFKTSIHTWEFRAFSTKPDMTDIYGEWKEFDRPI